MINYDIDILRFIKQNNVYFLLIRKHVEIIVPNCPEIFPLILDCIKTSLDNRRITPICFRRLIQLDFNNIVGK